MNIHCYNASQWDNCHEVVQVKFCKSPEKGEPLLFSKKASLEEEEFQLLFQEKRETGLPRLRKGRNWGASQGEGEAPLRKSSDSDQEDVEKISSEEFCSDKLTGTGLLWLKVQFSSVDQLCLTLWDPMGCREARQASLSFTISQSFAQIHVHWVDVAIQASHPLLSPSSPAFNLSQHQGLYQ